MKKEVTKCMVVFYILIETSVFIKKFAKRKITLVVFLKFILKNIIYHTDNKNMLFFKFLGNTIEKIVLMNSQTMKIKFLIFVSRLLFFHIKIQKITSWHKNDAEFCFSIL